MESVYEQEISGENITSQSNQQHTRPKKSNTKNQWEEKISQKVSGVPNIGNRRRDLRGI